VTTPSPAQAKQAALLDRVRKLLALASSPNVHEAASAATAAQSLIDRHRLQTLLDAQDDATAAQQDAADPMVDGRADPLETGRRVRKWRVVLACGLAEVNACLAYTAGSGRQRQLLVAGRDSDRAAVVALWQWLGPRIEWCSATAGPGQDRAWHLAFRIGAAEVIATRLAEAQQEDLANTSGTHLDPTDLIRVEEVLSVRAAALTAYAQEHLRLKPGRHMRVDADGYGRGRQAGAQLALDEPR